MDEELKNIIDAIEKYYKDANERIFRNNRFNWII